MGGDGGVGRAGGEKGLRGGRRSWRRVVEVRSSGGRVTSRSQVRTFLGEMVAMSRIRLEALTLSLELEKPPSAGVGG